MMRIKIPFGGLTPDQMDVLADLAEEYSDEVCHITTRQDVQLHYVHIDDTPDLMRRLAGVGITTREACGNAVRNVTACPLSGVCRDETFDVTPHAKACMRFLLGHPDTQDFGRKFKVAFSGCSEHACGLVSMHDLGFIAKTRVVNGIERRGFETYVGGGLGAVPHQAKLFDTFLPEAELLPIAQSMARVFARLGEKKNRARARIKFLVAQLGIEEFKRLVLKERLMLSPDPRWTAHLASVDELIETPLKPAPPLAGDAVPDGFERWRRTNAYRQRQSGYAVATIALPLGDLTARQMRTLADIARRYVATPSRTTVEQNIVLRWVREADLAELYRDLSAAGLGAAGAARSLTSRRAQAPIPARLGIASSRGLAAQLQTTRRYTRRPRPRDRGTPDQDERVLQLVWAASHCRSGVLRRKSYVRWIQCAAFQGRPWGQWVQNAGAYGLAVVAIPSKTDSRSDPANHRHVCQGTSFGRVLPSVH